LNVELTKALNTAMVFLLAYGIWQRRRPKVHIPVMLTAFAVDLVNVLLVELVARQTKGMGAVERATHAIAGEESGILQFHVTVSVLSIVGYVVAVITGTKLYKKGVGRKVHRVNAFIFVAMRLASYVTSFWV
jgi:uncharacterized membrane protein YozB (DUF420 family)